MNRDEKFMLYKALSTLVKAIEIGVTTETFLQCASRESSCLFAAREALAEYERNHEIIQKIERKD